MQNRITLTILDEMGRERQVRVDASRFTIGRISDNDLVIENSNLSRRHAIIETFDTIIQVSDCGSQNGTMVNGAPVIGAAALSDGDVITLGGVCEIMVGIEEEMESAAAGGMQQGNGAHSFAASHSASGAGAVNAYAPTQAGATPSWLGLPVIAAMVGVLILLVAGLFIIISSQDDSGSERDRDAREDRATSRPTPESTSENTNDNSSNVRITSDSNSNTGGGSTGVKVSREGDEIYAFALAVLGSVSKDPSPDLPAEVLNEVAEKVNRLKGSSQIAESLRSLKRNSASVSAQAKSKALKPALLAYAGLAESVGGGGDPAGASGQMLPKLARLRVTFGMELATDSLLIIAGYVDSSGNGYDLRDRITALVNSRNKDTQNKVNSTEARAVWYLHKENIVSDKAYDLVLRFIAVGVIAQDPSKFGVSAEPVTFE